MVKNIIFDFGAVLVDWNPKHLYGPYFNDEARMEHFLGEICPYSWNTTVDGGRSTADATAERLSLYPEWEREIRMYYGQWEKMLGGEIPGMEAIVRDLKGRGYGVWGLTNWSAETFPVVRDRYPVFSLLDGYVVSGEEKMLKPEARFYRLLLSRYSLRAEECVFIDDNPANIEGAEAVGIRGIVFEDAESLRAELEIILK